MDEHTGTHYWIRKGLCALAFLLLAGCEHLGTTKKFENPVVPPPPSRRLMGDGDEEEGSLSTSLASRSTKRTMETVEATPAVAGAGTRGSSRKTAGQTASRKTRGSKAGPGQAVVDSENPVAQASGSGTGRARPAGWKSNSPGGDESTVDEALVPGEETNITALPSDTELEGNGDRVDKGEVAATVNGAPIFVDDALQDHKLQEWLAQAKKKLPPEDFRRLRNELVEKRLPMMIQQELLIQALRSKLKDEQLKGMKKHLDVQFEKEFLPEIMQQVGATTPGELERRLRESGRSIDMLRDQFCNLHMAQQYLAMKAKAEANVDRPDLVDHYQQNIHTYAVPAQVKWQQIHLSYIRHGGKEKTRRLAEELRGQLENGADFAELAAKHSSGATASRGGHWDWMTEGSLAVKELDQTLFSMPIGDTIASVESAQSIDIVLVHDRRERGYKSFESVQHDIKKDLTAGERRRAVEELLQELEEHATVERFTDQLK